MAAGEVFQRTCTAIENPPSQIRSTNPYGGRQAARAATIIQMCIPTSLSAAIKAVSMSCWQQAFSPWSGVEPSKLTLSTE